MDKAAKIMVAGSSGLVGSAILRRLKQASYTNCLPVDRAVVDLTDQSAVRRWFEKERPEDVFLAAAKVGGILANKTKKADFILQNLQIQTNVIEAAWRNGVQRLLFLGSSCIYPKQCPQPMPESALLTGPLEETNDAYAVAKIAGIKLCQSFNEQYGTKYISVMPTNLYGPGDSFDLMNSHVIPALIRKFVEAKEQGLPEVILWGTGQPLREFLYVDDVADACVFLMNTYDGSGIVNIGSGEELSIRDLAGLIRDTIGYEGSIKWDATTPDGTARKLLDVRRLQGLGWRPHYSLTEGLRSTVEWYKNNRYARS
jgi:GDP-L-fucose synthase